MAAVHQAGKIFAAVPAEEEGILRHDALPQLGMEVQAVKKAVHIHHRAEHHQHRQEYAADHQRDHEQKHLGQAPLHIALIHLACAGDEGEAEGQKSVFIHVSVHSFGLS